MNTSLIIRDHLLIRWLMVESVCDIDQDPWQSVTIISIQHQMVNKRLWTVDAAKWVLVLPSNCVSTINISFIPPHKLSSIRPAQLKQIKTIGMLLWLDLLSSCQSACDSDLVTVCVMDRHHDVLVRFRRYWVSVMHVCLSVQTGMSRHWWWWSWSSVSPLSGLSRAHVRLSVTPCVPCRHWTAAHISQTVNSPHARFYNVYHQMFYTKLNDFILDSPLAIGSPSVLCHVAI